MTEEKIRRVHGIYGAVTAVLCILAGVALILACLSIYADGEGVFSREAVWSAFLSILVPLLLCALALIGGIFLSVFLPLPAKEDTPDTRLFLDRARVMRDRLFARVDLARAGEDTGEAVRREGRLRGILAAVGAVFASVCAIPPLVYFLNFSNFPNENLNAEVLSALLVLLPCLVLALTFLYAVARLTAASYDRECEALRAAVAAGAKREAEAEKTGAFAWFARNEKAVILALRSAVFALAVAFIILGVGNGGMNDVLQKAIRICTECIGLG